MDHMFHVYETLHSNLNWIITFLFAANHLPPTITDVMEDLYNYVNPLNGRPSPMVSKETRTLSWPTKM